MTKKTFDEWKEKYYPISAGDLVVSEADNEAIIKHSLTKWIGLQESVLSEYEVARQSNWIIFGAGKVFPIDESSCALCINATKDDNDQCFNCRLYEVLGGRCDYWDNKTKAPYILWTHKGNAMPMIMSLLQALNLEEKHNGHAITKLDDFIKEIDRR